MIFSPGCSWLTLIARKRFLYCKSKHAWQVYAVTLYVEAERAAKELGIRSRGGFFNSASPDDYATALSDGAFSKVLQVQLVRNVEGQQFYEVHHSLALPLNCSSS